MDRTLWEHSGDADSQISSELAVHGRISMRFIIGSAEALPILCVRCARRERERERERDGSDVTIFALKLAMSLHFPFPKIRTFRFSLHTSHLTLL